MAKISDEEAVSRLVTIIGKSLSGVDSYARSGTRIKTKGHGQQTRIDFLYAPIRPATDYIEKIQKRSRRDIATLPILIRSTSQYDGKFLKQTQGTSRTKGSNYYNKKKLTLFEQILIEFHRNPITYFNPQTKELESISLRRYLPVDEERLLSGNPQERQKSHIQESYRESERSISITKLPKKITIRTSTYAVKDGPILISRFQSYHPIGLKLL